MRKQNIFFAIVLVIIVFSFPTFASDDHLFYEPLDVEDLQVIVNTDPSLVLYLNKHIAYLDNEVVYIDSSNSNITPLLIEDVTFVPIRFISESLGGKINWFGDISTAVLEKNGKVISIPVNEMHIIIDGEKVELEMASLMIEGRLYVPLDVISDAFDMNVFSYNDLIVITKENSAMVLPRDLDIVEQRFDSYLLKDVKIPILMYHHFDEVVSRYLRSTTVTPDLFEEHLISLKAHGYNSITFMDLYDFIHNDKKLPDNPFILTIDDGYLSNYIYAYPLLEKYETKATIFVVTSSRGQTPGIFPHFTWEQAKEMEDSGWIEIHNHGLHHNHHTQMSDEDLIESILLSTADIEKHLGERALKVFAYPEGNHNKGTIDILLDLGYDVQLTRGNELTDKGSDLFDLARFNITYTMSGEMLIDMIEGMK
ncbi:peptidoglycan/xylan/chitin deacetylase (PgdA/CDA1 family) [Natranaerovirga pectinivora]|uniref:Peptidoglycan/xylan/chitin deacetylase (PgdA/CDA1 family) n=1 Tax=Natranaerovirga pectinivora TaxID=682400 RepID=A0A4R3MG55_9FIRM|nr:polysaccharide deacetylase family protein [Natranaerovirga pectinivora]TCT12868.1 peptidoglycan/xylan/chitin deacetylase (PgdA/CDA1 family) [Natranaerovirga pectinivora]